MADLKTYNHIRSNDRYWKLALKSQTPHRKVLDCERIRIILGRVWTWLFGKEHIFVTNELLLRSLEPEDVHSDTLEKRLSHLENCFEVQEQRERVQKLWNKINTPPPPRPSSVNGSGPTGPTLSDDPEKKEEKARSGDPTTYFFSKEKIDVLLDRCLKVDFEAVMGDPGFIEDFLRLKVLKKETLLTRYQSHQFEGKIVPSLSDLFPDSAGLKDYCNLWVKKFAQTNAFASMIQNSNNTNAEEIRKTLSLAIKQGDYLALFGLLQNLEKCIDPIDFAEVDGFTDWEKKDEYLDLQQCLRQISDKEGLTGLFTKETEASHYLLFFCLSPLTLSIFADDELSKHFMNFLKRHQTTISGEPERVLAILSQMCEINAVKLKNNELGNQIFNTLKWIVSHLEKKNLKRFSTKDIGYEILRLIYRARKPLGHSASPLFSDPTKVSPEESFIYWFLYFRMNQDDILALPDISIVIPLVQEERLAAIIDYFYAENESQNGIFDESLQLIESCRVVKKNRKIFFDLDVDQKMQKSILSFFRPRFPGPLKNYEFNDLFPLSETIVKSKFKQTILANLQKEWMEKNQEEIEQLIQELFPYCDNFLFGYEILLSVLLPRLPKESAIFTEQKEIGKKIAMNRNKIRSSSLTWRNDFFNVIVDFRLDFSHYDPYLLPHDVFRGETINEYVANIKRELANHQGVQGGNQTSQLIEFLQLLEQLDATSSTEKKLYLNQLIPFMESVLEDRNFSKGHLYILDRILSAYCSYKKTDSTITYSSDKLLKTFQERMPDSLLSAMTKVDNNDPNACNNLTVLIETVFCLSYDFFAKPLLSQPGENDGAKEHFAWALFLLSAGGQRAQGDYKSFGLSDSRDVIYKQAFEAGKKAYEKGLSPEHCPALIPFFKSLEFKNRVDEDEVKNIIERIEESRSLHTFEKVLDPTCSENLDSVKSFSTFFEWVEKQGKGQEVTAIVKEQCKAASTLQLQRWCKAIASEYKTPSNTKAELLLVLLEELPKESLLFADWRTGKGVFKILKAAADLISKEKYLEIFLQFYFEQGNWDISDPFPPGFFTENADRDSLSTQLENRKKSEMNQNEEECLEVALFENLSQRSKVDPVKRDDRLFHDLINESRSLLDSRTARPALKLNLLSRSLPFLSKEFKEREETKSLAANLKEQKSMIEKMVWTTSFDEEFDDIQEGYAQICRFVDECSDPKTSLIEFPETNTTNPTATLFWAIAVQCDAFHPPLQNPHSAEEIFNALETTVPNGLHQTYFSLLKKLCEKIRNSSSDPDLKDRIETFELNL